MTHPVIAETQQYLRDELAYLLRQRLSRAQAAVDEMQNELDKRRKELDAWEKR